MARVKSKPTTKQRRWIPPAGCSSDAVRARMRCFLVERKATEPEIRGWLKGRVTTQRIHDFGEKYPVSYDWLLCGDLKGLHRMARGTFNSQAAIEGAAS